MRGEIGSACSFDKWVPTDPLPEYEDHVSGVKLSRPVSDGIVLLPQISGEVSRGNYFPAHPAFGPTSVVPVQAPVGLNEMRKKIGESKKVNVSDLLSLDLYPTSSTWSNGSSGNGINVPVLPVATGPTTQRTFADAYHGSTGPIDFLFLSQPPHYHRMFHSSGPRGRSFSINLIFLNLGRPPQRYRVYATMPVRVLHYRIAIQLLRIDPRGIRIFVNDEVLFHRGTISDQLDPDRPTVPTPFLIPNSTAEVRLVPVGNFGPAPRAIPNGHPGATGTHEVLTIDPPVLIMQDSPLTDEGFISGDDNSQVPAEGEDVIMDETRNAEWN
jgi:hypothetical protein